MASVKDTVKFAMLSYPDISQTVGSVLHHIFYVNGNGMRWIDGELVSSYELIEIPIDVKALAQRERVQYLERIEEYKSKELLKDYDASFELERELYNYEFTVTNIDRVVSERGLHEARYEGRDLYPLCEYAKIMSVPDNVKTDWLWAAYHFAENTLTSLRESGELTKEELRYSETLPSLKDRFEDLLIARGEMASRKERDEMAVRICEILAGRKGASPKRK